MATWPKVKLADSVNLLAGFPFKSQQFTDKPDDVPLVKGENVSQGCILWDISKRWPASDWEKMEKFHLVPGDVVIAMDRPWIPAGLKWSFIRAGDPKALLVQRCARLRSSNGRLDQNFLRFVIGGPGFESYVKPITTGVNVPHISGQQILDFEFTLPPLPVQRRIAGILSAYDELMENSQRRIRLLEAMARALYREWFVHFRFPGHENHPRVASPLGDIPQGWEVKTIADVCESVSYGYTASASREEVGPKFLRITDIVPATIDWAGVPFCEIPKDKAPKYLVKHGDIVVARTGATTGYAKRLNKLHPDTVFASYLVRARAKAGVSNRMLGIVMESDEYKQYIQTNIGGAAQPQANAVVLTSMRLAVPPSSVSEKFDRLVAPMIDEAELLAVKIQNLLRTRDLLLPRLLSGQVEPKTQAA
jgi:type I restriction enzyme S subunit